MRDFLKSSGRWLRVGWFWPLVLLALPTCGLMTGGFNGPFLQPGPQPWTGAVMCDIPQPQGTHCASDAEKEAGFDMSQAALALKNGASTTIGLDYSEAALAECNGEPKATIFLGPWPDGNVACLNCATQIHTVYADANAVCVDLCRDLVGFGNVPQPPGEQTIEAYCQANARVSTNFDKNTCFDNACTFGGTLRSDFVDPRRTPEDVKWVEHHGTSAVGSTLTRDDDTTGSSISDFNAGAASDLGQLITHGDAWIEFEANENTLSKVLGVSSSCTSCSDDDGTLNDIEASLGIFDDGFIYELEKDQVILNVNELNGSRGPYAPHERFALWIEDAMDGTANVSYWRVSTPCTLNSCSHTFITSYDGPNLKYPIRVDASLRDKDATLANVTIMRIK